MTASAEKSGGSASNPNNPYIVGRPLGSDVGFYGRRDILSWVERSLRNLSNNSLVLFGQRRIGKTSILYQLQRRLPQEDFLPVYFDLQDAAHNSLAQVMSELAEDIAEATGLSHQAPSESENVEWFQRQFLPLLYGELGESRRPVLLFDEFDALDYSEKLNLPEDAAARSLFPYLRSLMSQQMRLAFVFAIGRQAEDLSHNLLATFKASLAKEVWVLDEQDARDLILEAQRQGTLSFTEEAVERILSFTQGHPYLTQLLCSVVWDRLHVDKPSVCPVVDAEDVDKAVPIALEQGGHVIEWIWDGLSPTEKIFSTAIAEATRRSNESISTRRIEQILADHAPRLRNQQIIEAPTTLTKRRILVQEHGESYRFAVEMIRIWTKQNKRLAAVKHELDRIDPVADEQFKTGESFFKLSKWQEAIAWFQKALDFNPEHFQARLFVGEALLRIGSLPEAIRELEQAYRMDPDFARDALSKAWRVQANGLGSLDELQDKDLPIAIATYRRLAELHPEEPPWRDALAYTEKEATLVDRFTFGIKALKEERWATAQRAFADVVNLRPAFQRNDFAAALLLESVQSQPEAGLQAERQLASASLELAYGLNAQQYGMGYENVIAQCMISPDGSGVFRREITLKAYDVVSELNFYDKLPEKPENGDDYIRHTRVRSMDPEREIKPEVIDDKNQVEVRNVIVPPLLPGEILTYEAVVAFQDLFAIPPEIDMNSRKMLFDYYARDINGPARRLLMEVILPPGIEPMEPWAAVWYAVGMSMVPHPSEGQRAKNLLSQRLLGEQYVLTLDVEWPVLGLTYVIAWRPDLLIGHSF
jgi:tetratricopeptide (TPR) repeat protein